MTDQEKIDEILDNFDFERVHRCMAAMNWTWQSTVMVPDIADLRMKARGLLKQLIESEYDEMGSGGLRVERKGDFLRLSFVVTEWDIDV